LRAGPHGLPDLPHIAKATARTAGAPSGTGMALTKITTSFYQSIKASHRENPPNHPLHLPHLRWPQPNGPRPQRSTSRPRPRNHNPHHHQQRRQRPTSPQRPPRSTRPTRRLPHPLLPLRPLQTLQILRPPHHLAQNQRPPIRHRPHPRPLLPPQQHRR